jgi:hypothetical protein
LGDVLIVDLNQGGKAYPPAEFATFYKDVKEWANRRAPQYRATKKLGLAGWF